MRRTPPPMEALMMILFCGSMVGLAIILGNGLATIGGMR